MESGFWDDNGGLVSALVTIGLAFLVALVVDRVIIARAKNLADRVSDARGVTIGVSRKAQTRLRLIRRLTFLLILLIGLAFALRNVHGAEKLATGILASSAVLGIVVGFAARQSVANLIAGVVLAIAQPIRIGDRVTFGDADLGNVTGRVDDITLTYTYLNPGDGTLLVVPNEHVVSDAIFNHSTGDLTAPVSVELWLPLDADVPAARKALADIADQVELTEGTHEAIKLKIARRMDGETTRLGGEEEVLREKAHSALREAGVLSPTES